MNAGELGAFSYSMLMVVFGLLFRVGVLRMVFLVRCASGAKVLVVFVFRFGVIVLFWCGFVVLCVGVSAIWCVFGGLSGMFFIAVLIESLSGVLFLPSSWTLSMLAIMSETAVLRVGILWYTNVRILARFVMSIGSVWSSIAGVSWLVVWVLFLL